VSGYVLRPTGPPPAAGERVLLPLGARPSLSEPAVAAELDRRVSLAQQEAYIVGHAAGVQDATVALDARLVAAADAVGELADDLATARTALREEIAGDVVRLAVALTQTLVGRTLEPDVAALAARVEAALANVDDDTATVRAPAGQASALIAMLDRKGHTLRVVTDHELAPGEARIVGRFVTAELTTAALIDTLAGHLDDLLAADPDVHRSTRARGS
jgi:flagellar biosynthesis/type III secretory pathway protein FliH